MRTCWRAIRYFRADRGLIAFLVILVGCNFATGIWQANPLPVLLDLLFAPGDRAHPFFMAILPTSTMGRIVGIALVALSLKFADLVLGISRNMINKRVQYNGLARVRRDLYAKFQSMPVDYHRNRNQGDTLYRLTTDTQSLFGVLDLFIGASIACVTVVVVSILMLRINMPLALATLAIIPPLIVTNIYFTPRIKRRADVAKQKEADFTTTVQQSLNVIGLIQSFCRQGSDFQRVDGSIGSSNNTNWRLDWTQSLYNFAIQAFFGIGASIIIGYGGYLAYRDQILHPIPNGFTIGDLLLFLYYAAMFNDPINRITGFKAMIQNSVAAADRVFAILDEPAAIQDSPDARPLPRRARTLSLQNVSFAYPSPNGGAPVPVLHGINATITPGQFVAFIGPSGAGKSTLFSLLPRFYDPIDGGVKLDGHNIRDISIADLRKHIAVVQQESPLFPGSIADNIAFARPEASLADIYAAAEAAGAHEFIMSLADGYDTVIAEGAQNLSGGQRQRLALARALLADTPILILDEPTSAQDPHHANAILETLLALRGSRTILLVTHDLELVEDADRLYVLKQGRLVETGTHSQLIAEGGVYHSMRTAEPATDSSVTLHIAS